MLTPRFCSFYFFTSFSAESGIVSSVAAPLADAGISIFQLSTYESDYCLVPEEKLTVAINCLKSAFKIQDVVLLDGNGTDEGRSNRNGSLTSRPAGDNGNGADLVSRNMGEVEHITDSSGHRRNGFSVAPYQLYLTSISKEYVDAVSAPLIKLIFYPEKCVFVGPFGPFLIFCVGRAVSSRSRGQTIQFR